MTILSLFDGMSCGQLALKRVGIHYENYISCEIDKYAIQVCQHNFPDTIQAGDVTKLTGDMLPSIDLLIGGSPCQGFSFAGKQLNFEDSRSKLFFEYVRLWEGIKKENPDALFLLENVKMKKQYQDVISELLGVEPIEINSALVSAQNRKRLYWTNITGITQPEDRGILLKEILETNPDSKYNHSQEAIEYMNREVKCGGNRFGFGYVSDSDKDKSACLVANMFKGVPYNVLIDRKYFLSEKALARVKRRNYSKPVVNPEKTGTLNTKNNSAQLSLDSGTTLITEPFVADKFYLTEDMIEAAKKSYASKQWISGNKMGAVPFPTSVDGKAKTLCASSCGGNRSTDHIDDNAGIRRLTPKECERLQTVPDNYTSQVSDTQRYKMLGNGWTVDVIAHIFKHINKC
jgi:DNA-cytosine methyltransferase